MIPAADPSERGSDEGTCSDHVLRPQLPWRSDANAITECGYDATKVKAITREELQARLTEFGQQRTSMLTCMTCVDTATRWLAWEPTNNAVPYAQAGYVEPPVSPVPHPVDVNALIALLLSMDDWLGNSEGLMIEDVVDWREQLAKGLGRARTRNRGGVPGAPTDDATRLVQSARPHRQVRGVDARGTQSRAGGVPRALTGHARERLHLHRIV